MNPSTGYHIEVTSPPTAPPITLAEAKAHLRVLHTSEDALIERLIKVAAAHAERVTGRAFITKTVRMTFDAFPAQGGPLRLLKSPLITLSSVVYTPPAGADVTLASDDYQIVPDAVGAMLFPPAGSHWPATTRARRALVVTYTAGYGDSATDVPEDLRNALLLLVEHYYYNRSAVSDTPKAVTPMAVDALLGPFKTTGWI